MPGPDHVLRNSPVFQRICYPAHLQSLLLHYADKLHVMSFTMEWRKAKSQHIETSGVVGKLTLVVAL
jgi:hypothetical protein